MSGYISPPVRAKLLTKAELRETVAGLEERNMSTKGEPNQLSMRLARAMLKEIEYEDRLSKQNKNNKNDKRTRLFKHLTQKFGLKIWKNLGTNGNDRYVETYTNPNLGSGKKRRSPNRRTRTYSDVGKSGNGNISKESSEAEVPLASTPRIQEFPCSLCEKMFTKNNLPGTVTLRAVWKKREQFPLNLKMPKVLKNNWTKLYSEVQVCIFCAQIFQILKEEERVPFPRPKNNNFRFTSTQHVVERDCAFGSSAVQRPGLFPHSNSNADGGLKTVRSDNGSHISVKKKLIRPSTASPSVKHRNIVTSNLSNFSLTRPHRPSTPSRIKRNVNTGNVKGFGISSPRLMKHRPQEQSLKSFMAERHPPSFNPFKVDKKTLVNDVTDAETNTISAKNKKKKRKRRGKRRKIKKKKEEKDWSMFGEFQF
jgi:hypothetical protein